MNLQCYTKILNDSQNAFGNVPELDLWHLNYPMISYLTCGILPDLWYIT